MVLSTALKIAAPLRSRPMALAVAAATFLAIAALRLPLAPVLVSMTALSMLLMWHTGR